MVNYQNLLGSERTSGTGPLRTPSGRGIPTVLGAITSFRIPTIPALRSHPGEFLCLALVSLVLVVGCRGQDDPDTPRIPVVNLIADGREQQFQTTGSTVGELLEFAGVELDDLDRIEPGEYTPLSDGLVIRVVRVRYETETGPERIVPYEKQIVQDTSVPAGESRILEPGVNGIEQTVFRVVYEDDVEVERVPVRSIVVQEARPETVLVGVRETFTPTPIKGTVAYLSGNRAVGYNAWVMRRSSGSQRRMTFDGTLDTRVFALSPDGSRLLFTRHISETTSRASEEHFNSLWLVNTTVSNAEPVDLRLNDVLWADWSPDGEGIAYSTGKVAVGSPGWQAHNDLWTARINDRLRLADKTEVFEGTAGGAFFWWGTNYAWSPDRRYIAYAQPDNIGFVRLQDGKRTELSRFAPLNTYSNWVWVPELSWSPDSRFLTTVLHGPSITGESPEDSQVFDVWVFDIEHPLTVKHVSQVGMWAAPTWSSNGGAPAQASYDSQIAFARARSPYESANSSYDLYVMDRDGSNRQRVFPPDGDLGLKGPRFEWGPDGRQLITIYGDDLYLVDIAQDNVRRLTIDSSAQAVEWSP
jgi:Tol biopolymer transport system component